MPPPDAGKDDKPIDQAPNGTGPKPPVDTEPKEPVVTDLDEVVKDGPKAKRDG